MNRWCLEELVRRDPHNFVILLQKILKKTKEVDILNKKKRDIIFLTIQWNNRKVTGPSPVWTGAGAVPLWTGGSPHSPLLFCSPKSEYSDAVTDCGARSTSIINPDYCTFRRLMWLQTGPCCRRPSYCSIVSWPGPSLASLPVSVCWTSSSRSSERQVRLNYLAAQRNECACRRLASVLMSHHQVFARLSL